MPYYNRDQHQRILGRFTSTISLINEYLPDDQKLATQVRDRRDADFVILPEDIVLLLEFVEKLVAAGAEPRGSVAATSLGVNGSSLMAAFRMIAVSLMKICGNVVGWGT